MNDLKNLLPDTVAVLRKLAKLNFVQNFTFVGGSALAIYLKHRYSEDIDLFTWEKSLDISNISNTLYSKGFKKMVTVNLSKTQADFIIDGVKLTFFANEWNELNQRVNLFDNLYIAKLETIAVMKVNTLFMRAKFRDYYDLYVLNKDGFFTLPELYELTCAKMNNLSIALFQRALTFTGDIQDESIKELKPKYNVTLKQIEEYFYQEIIKWNKQINID